MQVTVRWVVTETDGGYDRLWGFPFGFISGNLGCTGCYEIYITAMFCDLLLKFTVALILFNLIERSGLKLKTHWLGIIIGCLVMSFWVFMFCLLTFDSHFKWVNEINYKVVSWNFCWGLHSGW